MSTIDTITRDARALGRDDAARGVTRPPSAVLFAFGMFTSDPSSADVLDAYALGLLA